MMKMYIFLLFVAMASARPTTTSTTTGIEKDEIRFIEDIIKEVRHLSDEDITALKQQGVQMLKELEEKKNELEARGRQEVEDFIQLSQILKENAEEQVNQYKKEAEEIKSKELPFNFNQGE